MYTSTGMTPQLGETAPDFALETSTGELWSLARNCARAPQILIFYRGHW
ncbi:MAG: hypothetical protein ACRD50_11895 [Candidatus Acidiferrales bacterium]